MLEWILGKIAEETASGNHWHEAGYELRDAVAHIVDGVRTGSEPELDAFHHLLAILNRQRLSIDKLPSLGCEQFITGLCVQLENEWLSLELEKIRPRLHGLPEEPELFLQWFETLQETGYGQNHPLFLYLAERADWDELRYFFLQEMGTEAGFDDLVAMVQVRTPIPVKMELAHNYWDEMGQGKVDGMHSVKLFKVAEGFGLAWRENFLDVHWTSLALSNLMIALATRRALFAQAVGALGVIEMTSPGRCVEVVRGLQRVGLDRTHFQYYALHAVIDKKHWTGWREQVMRPLLQQNPAYAAGMAAGALLRLFAGNRCFEHYSHYMGLQELPESRDERLVPQTGA